MRAAGGRGRRRHGNAPRQRAGRGGREAAAEGGFCCAAPQRGGLQKPHRQCQDPPQTPSQRSSPPQDPP